MGGHPIVDYGIHLRRRGVAPSTIAAYQANLRTFLRENPGWQDATAESIERWLDQRQGRRGPLTATRRGWWVTLLVGFYGWALLTKACAVDPTGQLTRPRQRGWQPDPIADADAAVLLALAGPDPCGRAVALMLYAGLRCAEVSGLLWRDVDRGNGVLRVTGKGEKVRRVALHPCLDDALGAAGTPDAPVIGVRWCPNTVGRHVAQAMHDAGIPGHAHQLRHTFATNAYAHQGDAFALRDVLGHTSVVTTQAYIRVADAARSRTVASVSYDRPGGARQGAPPGLAVVNPHPPPSPHGTAPIRSP